MKKLLFLLLLITSALHAQVPTGQEQEFDYGIKNNATQLVPVPNYLVTQGATGVYGKIEPIDLQISNAVIDSIQKKQNLPTGFLTGLQLSINADPTKFNIAAGYYTIANFSDLNNPYVHIEQYAGITGVTPTYLGTANATYIALDTDHNITQQSTPFTNAQRRTLAIIGSVIHSNNININAVNEIKAPIVAPTNQLHDFMRAIGSLNEEGNIYSPNGANLQINKSAGRIFALGINANDYLNPHELTIPAQTALTFRYRLRGGTEYADTQNVDPNNYDNAGVLTAVTAGNKWTIQHFNIFQSGLTRAQHGQTVYNSYAEALAALPTDPFVTEQNIADNAVFRAYLIIKQGTTDLQASVAAGTALFVPVDKFGNVVGNGAIALTYANIVAALGYTPANNADVVKLTTNQTIAGVKSITNSVEPATSVFEFTNNFNGGLASSLNSPLRVLNNLNGIGQHIWNKDAGAGLYILNDTNGVNQILHRNIAATGDFIRWQTTGTQYGKIDYLGKLYSKSFNIIDTPTTSAGSYDILTRNSSNGEVEKISDLVSQITITTSTSITTATLGTSGYSQKGRNVIIDNGANAINLTVNGGTDFVSSYLKHGSAAITFVQGSGRTLIQVSGTAILNGVVGSTATISSVGTTDYLIISNR